MICLPLTFRASPARRIQFGAIALGFLLSTASAVAGSITSYNGLDNNAPVGGPFPNSAAAAAALANAGSAYGALSTITFEGLPVGYSSSPTPVAPGVTLTQTGLYYGNGGSGISNVSLSPSSGPQLFGFNTTLGGSYFLGSSTDATTFNFASPTHSFGFYGTGLQFPASIVITFMLNDGLPRR